MTRRWFPAAVALAAAALVGCSDKRATAPVHGTVTYKGKPVPTGMVLFVPKEPGPTATGRIGPDGQYRLSTYGSDDGAVLGEHSVMIAALEDLGDKPPDAMNLPKSLVPEKYGDYRKSGLSAEVKPDDNTVDLPLK